MANLRILIDNAAERATITADPAMLNTLPVTQLQRPLERSAVARTDGLASQDIKLTWPSAESITMAALVRHNLTKDVATWRNLGYPTDDWTGTADYDSTAVVAFSSAGLTARNRYTGADFAGMRNSAIYFPKEAAIESWITRLADASNASGYMEAHQLWLGEYFELRHQPDYGGIEMQLMDASSASRAADGTHVVSRAWRARRIVVKLDYIEDAHDLADLLDIAQVLGTTGECWLDAYPDETGALGIYHRGLFRLVESPIFAAVQYGTHRNSLVFEEI